MYWPILNLFVFNFQKLETDSEDSYLDSQWAESSSLRRQFHGLTNIQFKPGKKLWLLAVRNGWYELTHNSHQVVFLNALAAESFTWKNCLLCGFWTHTQVINSITAHVCVCVHVPMHVLICMVFIGGYKDWVARLTSPVNDAFCVWWMCHWMLDHCI